MQMGVGDAAVRIVDRALEMRAIIQGGAVIAFTNPGGVRADVTRREDGAVTYGDLFASQPFRNQLVTLTLTGMQIKNMLVRLTASVRDQPSPLVCAIGPTAPIWPASARWGRWSRRSALTSCRSRSWAGCT